MGQSELGKIRIVAKVANLQEMVTKPSRVIESSLQKQEGSLQNQEGLLSLHRLNDYSKKPSWFDVLQRLLTFKKLFQTKKIRLRSVIYLYARSTIN